MSPPRVEVGSLTGRRRVVTALLALWLGFAEEDFAVANGEGDFGEGGDVLSGECGAQRKKLAT